MAMRPRAPVLQAQIGGGNRWCGSGSCVDRASFERDDGGMDSLSDGSTRMAFETVMLITLPTSVAVDLVEESRGAEG